VFTAHESRARYLKRFSLADLFLDTHWFNAMTTACDAMATGLPVLTCPGDALPSRVAASLVHAAGLPQMVVASLDEYEERAVHLATSRSELASLRETLAANLATAPLFDAQGRARELETAYEVMWRRHAAGLTPDSFAVPL
jgi:predicted O-linked N-acetylglucosamine transferase (SPINDLY family)